MEKQNTTKRELYEKYDNYNSLYQIRTYGQRRPLRYVFPIKRVKLNPVDILGIHAL